MKGKKKKLTIRKDAYIYGEKKRFSFFSSFDLKEKFLSAPRPKKNGKK